MQSTLQSNLITNGTVFISTQTQPNICPGCGKCNVCGRQNEIPNPQPYPSYTWTAHQNYNTGGDQSDVNTASIYGGTVTGLVGGSELAMALSPVDDTTGVSK